MDGCKSSQLPTPPTPPTTATTTITPTQATYEPSDRPGLTRKHFHSILSYGESKETPTKWFY
eukprot:CAMPEP_0197470850 /NCGR_PEP_ID=MMETSP1309-20131121/1666_1 /TAXON_ID=464262 /ORGANISM="Genus nov. species nov., Strain RCC998" /LENGTH=61 /DNA_ID=CAMNT_0043008091 /DNA_START=16 /DNA_END=198 /DNA_ORIENTATION=-